jgi:hypothetical protein
MLLIMSQDSDGMQATGHKFSKKIRRRGGGEHHRTLTFIVLHYHLRPGGIRRVIELAMPHLCQRLGHVKRVIVACGEAHDAEWKKLFASLLHPIPVSFFVKRAFGYFAEQKLPAAKFRVAVAASLKRLLDELTEERAVVWAHNLGVGRNLILADELAQACDRRDIPLISHHHDLWFDNRWLRWKDIRAAGFRSLAEAGRTIFPGLPVVRHAAINSADANVLRRHFGGQSACLPNPANKKNEASRRGERNARRWLGKKIGAATPIWILPCRLLRRKNIAEALLLTRWLRPEAWLVTTGGASSRDELAYEKKLAAAARKHGWRLRLGILADGENEKPSVPELMAASECVLLTSVQEGFGLPYLEAASARRPLIARRLPNIAPDLARFGFQFTEYYEDILVRPGLFNWTQERIRQKKKFLRWRKQLPRAVRKFAVLPPILSAAKPPRGFPFSQLTLDAQLEVLRQPAAISWKLCAPLNPFLQTWRRRIAQKKLAAPRWPKTADRFLSGRAYAEKFARLLLSRPPRRQKKNVGASVQKEFIEVKLGEGNRHPLLWDSDV